MWSFQHRRWILVFPLLMVFTPQAAGSDHYQVLPSGFPVHFMFHSHIAPADDTFFAVSFCTAHISVHHFSWDYSPWCPTIHWIQLTVIICLDGRSKNVRIFHVFCFVSWACFLLRSPLTEIRLYLHGRMYVRQLRCTSILQLNHLGVVRCRVL